MKLPFCAVSIVFYPVKYGIFGNVHVNEHFSTESVEQDSLTRILFIYICTFIQYIPSFQLLQSLEESMTFARQIFINLNVKILKSSHIEFSLVLYRHYIHTQHTIQCNLMVSSKLIKTIPSFYCHLNKLPVIPFLYRRESSLQSSKSICQVCMIKIFQQALFKHKLAGTHVNVSLIKFLFTEIDIQFYFLLESIDV